MHGIFHVEHANMPLIKPHFPEEEIVAKIDEMIIFNRYEENSAESCKISLTPMRVHVKMCFCRTIVLNDRTRHYAKITV